MTNILNYYFATSSPWAYFATPRIKTLEEKYKLIIKWKPCNLMEIFAKNGTLAVKDRPQPVQLNRLNELKRWGKYLSMNVNIHPKYFPVDPTISHKAIIAVQKSNINPFNITFSFMKAVWTDEKDISNNDTIKEIIKNCGLESNSVLEEVNSEEINSLYIQNTEEAIKNNVWGSPTFIYNNELFWGQDRLEFLEKWIQSNYDVC